jgi:hypothetical protein
MLLNYITETVMPPWFKPVHQQLIRMEIMSATVCPYPFLSISSKRLISLRLSDTILLVEMVQLFLLQWFRLKTGPFLPNLQSVYVLSVDDTM